jgi:hypothetical protein
VSLYRECSTRSFFPSVSAAILLTFRQPTGDRFCSLNKVSPEEDAEKKGTFSRASFDVFRPFGSTSKALMKKKSSLRIDPSSKSQKFTLRPRRVRFKGIPGSFKISLLAWLIRHFRPGAATINKWNVIMAIVTTFGMICSSNLTTMNSAREP